MIIGASPFILNSFIVLRLGLSSNLSTHLLINKIHNIYRTSTLPGDDGLEIVTGHFILCFLQHGLIELRAQMNKVLAVILQCDTDGVHGQGTRQPGHKVKGQMSMVEC